MTTNTATIPTHDAPFSLFGVDEDRKARNEAKAQEQGLEPCAHCGRGVAEGRGWLIVVIEGGAQVIHPDNLTDDLRNDGGFMGAWVLGSTCAKGIPAAFRAKWEGWGN